MIGKPSDTPPPNLHNWDPVIDDENDLVAVRLAVPSGWIYYTVMRTSEDSPADYNGPTFVPDPFAAHCARGVH